MRLIIWQARRGASLRFLLPLAFGAGLFACLAIASWPAAWPTFSVGLDAGHGGIDPGAIGQNGLQEKLVTLRVARLVADMLIAEGEEAILTRDSDKRLGSSQRSDLQARVHVAHRHPVDLLVSIHCNGYRLSSVRGPRTYYQPNSETGRKLASAIQQELRKTVGYGQTAPTAEDHLLTRESVMTAVIVELGYITNPNEERLLGNLQYQRKLARAVVNGIKNYAAQAGLP